MYRPPVIELTAWVVTLAAPLWLGELSTLDSGAPSLTAFLAREVCTLRGENPWHVAGAHRVARQLSDIHNTCWNLHSLLTGFSRPVLEHRSRAAHMLSRSGVGVVSSVVRRAHAPHPIYSQVVTQAWLTMIEAATLAYATVESGHPMRQWDTSTLLENTLRTVADRISADLPGA